MRNGADTGTIERGSMRLIVVIAAHYVIVVVSHKSIKQTKPEEVQMKIKQIASNQTELSTNGMIVLFSYSTPVAAMLPSGRYVKTSTKYSVTTTKHVNKWLQGVGDSVELVEQSFINNLTSEVA